MIKWQFAPDDIKTEKNIPKSKDEFKEITSENFEDICEDKSGFCMIGFLPAITSIDYEKKNFERIIEMLDQW